VTYAILDDGGNVVGLYESREAALDGLTVAARDLEPFGVEPVIVEYDRNGLPVGEAITVPRWDVTIAPLGDFQLTYSTTSASAEPRWSRLVPKFPAPLDFGIRPAIRS